MDVISLQGLLKGFSGLTIGAAVMMAVGGVLIWLAIHKEYEPLLLLPIGLGCILANVPNTGMLDEGGLLNVLYNAGIENELFPSLVFIGIGAMTDFGPLLENPKFVLLGAAAQFGIFGTLLLAFVMRHFGVPVAPALIGVVLGPIAETELRRALAASAGDPSILVGSGISVGLYVLVVLAALLPLAAKLRRARSGRDTGGDGGGGDGGERELAGTASR